MSKLYIIAGPNGAGKTTAAFTILPEILFIKEFVNADEIARGISPFNPQTVAIQAGKVMLKRIEHLLSEKSSFAIETTLTTIGYLNTIESAKLRGYEVTLVYIWLENLELAINRVKSRVLKGGHDIPKDIIERRYFKSLKNLPKFIELVTAWYLYNNSKSSYELIAKGNNLNKEIFNSETYTEIFPNEKK